MYTLVNPAISGTFNTNYDSLSSIDAAKHFWNQLSQYLVDNVPQMFFTLRDNNGRYYHFKVAEKVNDEKKVDFKIDQITLMLSSNDANKLDEQFNNVLQQRGGNKEDDSDSSSISSSSSSSSISDDDKIIKKFKKFYHSPKPQQFQMFYYIPDIYRQEDVFLPVFRQPYAHYIKLGFSSAIWGK